MPAEFVGLPNIIKNLERYEFDGLAVFRGKEEPFRRYAQEGDSTENLINAFEAWANDMLESNSNNYQIYKVQLYEYPEGAKKRLGTVSFSFQLMATPNTNHFKQKENNNMITGDVVHKDTMLLAIENERLKNTLERLEDRLNDLENEEEEEEEAPVGILGAVEQALQDKLPQLIDLAIGFLTPKNNMPVALGSNIDEIISEFRVINPNIESDLFKLLQLAKTNKPLFDMLINQLRAM
jgi:hypothetical protein